MVVRMTPVMIGHTTLYLKPKKEETV